MALIDEVVIRVISGAGGRGCISFRREKYVPYGGPDGGNGGDGGSVFFIPTHDKTSLLDFKYRPKFEADRGEHGLGKGMHGRSGEDLNIFVPVGTLIYDNQTNDLIADLIDEGVPLPIAKGGRGGRGNLTFTTSTNRAPRVATPGEAGQALELKLELRLIADVGLIGLPNAGKSSFLRVVSRAHPKVADYPFTTLEPHLGVVDHKAQSFVIADLPGLIEGASEGAGLGHKFLRHVSRNRILLHLVEVTSSPKEIQRNVDTIRNELSAFDPELSDRKEILVFTKIDLLDKAALTKKKKALKALGLDGYFISSHTQAGIEPLLDQLSLHAVSSAKMAVACENAAEPDLLVQENTIPSSPTSPSMSPSV
jgi:GTPase